MRKRIENVNQKEFRVGKEITRKGDKPYVKWKEYDNSFNSWVDKKGRIRVELDLSNYATKADLKNATAADLLKKLI